MIENLIYIGIGAGAIIVYLLICELINDYKNMKNALNAENGIGNLLGVAKDVGQS